MGLRMGFIIGTSLILTILGTFIIMSILEILWGAQEHSKNPALSSVLVLPTHNKILG